MQGRIQTHKIAQFQGTHPEAASHLDRRVDPFRGSHSLVKQVHAFIIPGIQDAIDDETRESLQVKGSFPILRLISSAVSTVFLLVCSPRGLQ